MKAASISPIALANYSLCDAAGRPRSLFRALPDGTLAAVTQAAKKAEAADRLVKIAEAAKPQTAAVGAIARASWFQRLPGGLLAQRLLLQRHVLLPARLLGGDVRPAVLPA